MNSIVWERFPLVTRHSQASAWLTMQVNLGLAHNTLMAYAAALEDYLHCASQINQDPTSATRETIAHYVHDLAARPNPRLAQRRGIGPPRLGGPMPRCSNGSPRSACSTTI